jgi:hypothetical protein
MTKSKGMREKEHIIMTLRMRARIALRKRDEEV